MQITPYNIIPKVHWQELLFRGVGGRKDIWGIVPSGGGETFAFQRQRSLWEKTFAFQMIILAQFLDIWSPGVNIAMPDTIKRHFTIGEVLRLYMGCSIENMFFPLNITFQLTKQIHICFRLTKTCLQGAQPDFHNLGVFQPIDLAKVQGSFFNWPPTPLKSSKYKKVNLGWVRCI